MTLKEWCKEILPIVQAAAKGEVIQQNLHEGWEDVSDKVLSFVPYVKYRIKPTTIRVGAYTIPMPLRSWDGVEVGTEYYVPSFCGGNYDELTYAGDAYDIDAIKSGVVHLGSDAAIAHAKALLSLMQENTK